MTLGFLGSRHHSLTVFCLEKLLLGSRMMGLNAHLIYQGQPYCGQTPGWTRQRKDMESLAWPGVRELSYRVTTGYE